SAETAATAQAILPSCCNAHRLASGVRDALWGDRAAHQWNTGCSCWVF
ncbi:MAG: hypothetical protein HC899_34425, partial [Leptolyngbyaceae cyanobacterium SM1_4_3]|nr:hypothetical protein [Leptolyngbyaceae cyanobacterium SM1_4_3]